MVKTLKCTKCGVTAVFGPREGQFPMRCCEHADLKTMEPKVPQCDECGRYAGYGTTTRGCWREDDEDAPRPDRCQYHRGRGKDKRNLIFSYPFNMQEIVPDGSKFQMGDLLYSETKLYVGCSSWVEFGRVAQSTRTGLLCLEIVPQEEVKTEGPYTYVRPVIDGRFRGIFVKIDPKTGYCQRKDTYSHFQLWKSDTLVSKYYDRGD